MPYPILFNRLLRFGRRSEIQASEYLRSLGYRIVSTNFLTRGGEIDLIAWDAGILVFVEVRSLRSDERPEASIGLSKQRRIAKAAQAYRARYKHQDAPFRFDVVAVNAPAGTLPSFRLFRDAFRPPGSN